MENKYYIQSLRERILLDELFKIIYNDKYDIKYDHTDPYGQDVYDSAVMRFDKNTTYIVDTHIFEAKVRDEDYDDILLEKKKYNDLKRISKRYNNTESKIFYVSCHPSGTYIFNLSTLKDIKWVERSLNKSTTELWKGKIDKQVTFLSKEIAKKIDIKNIDIDRIEKEKEVHNKIENTIKDQKKTRCLYQWLFSDPDNE